jgi:glucokinase
MKPKKVFAMNSQHYIGLDLGGTDLKFVLINEDLKIIDKGRQPSHGDGSRDKIIDGMISAVQHLRRNNPGCQINSIGIGTPGSVHLPTGSTMGVNPNMPNWNDVPVRDLMQNALNIPVVVDNDANLMALGEQKMGAGIGVKNAIGITLGTGVGGGIIIDDRLFRGAGYFGGEIGHIQIEHNGRKCGCGAYGCLETYASATGIVRSVEEFLEKYEDPKLKKAFEKEGFSVKELFALARNNNAAAQTVVETSVRYLGAGLGSLINVFNPERIIIGGGVSKAGSFFLDKIRTVIGDYTMPVILAKCEIVLAILGNDAGMLGAAILAKDWENYLNHF